MVHEITHRITFTEGEVKVAVERYLREVRDLIVSPHDLKFMDDKVPEIIVIWREKISDESERNE
jgi:hypothetical protein